MKWLIGWCRRRVRALREIRLTVQRRARLKVLRREFLTQFGQELPEDLSAWGELQPLVTRRLDELWQELHAVIDRRPETCRLEGVAWEEAQGQPEQEANQAYYRARQCSDALGFVPPPKHPKLLVKAEF